MKQLLISVAMVLTMRAPAYAEAPVVLELFTSQSCSSCPPADALLQSLSHDPSLLPLSFHVTYWDGADWRDPFSLRESTDRQRDYERSLKQDNVYTPELVVDGTKNMVGSRRDEVVSAINAARARPKPIAVAITPDPDGRHLSIGFTGAIPAGLKDVDIWLVTFDPKAVTAVRGGENKGSTLTSINNVTGITRVGSMGEAPFKTVQAERSPRPGDNYAVLVQGADAGEIVGAGSYSPAKP